jgi:hypothetical protein
MSVSRRLGLGSSLLVGLLTVATVSGNHGTASSLTGKITDRQSMPISGVVVEIIGRGARFRTATSSQGMFEFRGIEAGDYTLTAAHPAYLPYEHSEGDRRMIEISEGSSRVLTISMTRGGVLSGQVRQPDGEGAPDVLVSLKTAGQTIRQTWTDFRGRYRFFGLAQREDYTIAAEPSAGMQKLMYPATMLSEPDVDAVLGSLKGGSAGSPVATADKAGAPTAVTSGFAPVYYPGVSDASAALQLTVAEEQEIDGLDLSLVLSGTASISGRVTDSSGAVVSAVQVSAASEANGASYLAVRASQPDGFTIPNIPPGRYRVRARAWTDSTTPALPQSFRRLQAWGYADVLVTGTLEGVEIRMLPPPTVSGRVVGVDANTLVSPPAGIVIVLAPSRDSLGTQHRMAASSDGSFRLQVEPGTYTITARLPDESTKLWSVGPVTSARGEELGELVVSETGEAADIQIRIIRLRRDEKSIRLEYADGSAAGGRKQ